MKLSWRIWLLIFALIGSALIITPNFEKGVIIKSVDQNSTSYEQGLRTGMIIKSINGEIVNNFDDYSKIINSLFPTEKNRTTVSVLEKVLVPNDSSINFSINQSANSSINFSISQSINSSANQSINQSGNNESLKNLTKPFSNNSIQNKSLQNSKKNLSSGDEIKVTIATKNSEILLFIDEPPKITVENIPNSRIKTGLDLSGGARALVKPENVSISRADIDDLVTTTSNRLNTFGISDVSVRAVSDLSGNNFMLVEVAGATPSDLRELVSKQGKFEAKIGNETVFIGGERDITYVARTGEQSGIYSCSAYQGGEACSFRFTISLSEEAAKRHAEITGKLGVNFTNPQYLEKQLDLYLDDKLVDSLYIGKELKGSATTQIAISGSGAGTTREEAYNNAVSNMKKLQTILITGSLPYKLEILKLDTISPSLGKEFTRNIIILALIVFFAVSVSIFIRYRKIKITLSVILTMFSEAFITLAIAALIKWNLDAPSIAGIIAGMGTGVNDQIVILSEAISTEQTSIKERIKRALFIIFGAFFTIIAAMIPLFWAGAGLLKGFALTTIIGVSVGILITRPAFADIVKMIIKD